MPTRLAYIFGAVCPAKDKAAGLVLPKCNTAAMQLRLEEIALADEPGAHALLHCCDAWNNKLIDQPRCIMFLGLRQ